MGRGSAGFRTAGEADRDSLRQIARPASSPLRSGVLGSILTVWGTSGMKLPRGISLTVVAHEDMHLGRRREWSNTISGESELCENRALHGKT